MREDAAGQRSDAGRLLTSKPNLRSGRYLSDFIARAMLLVFSVSIGIRNFPKISVFSSVFRGLSVNLYWKRSGSSEIRCRTATCALFLLRLPRIAAGALFAAATFAVAPSTSSGRTSFRVHLIRPPARRSTPTSLRRFRATPKPSLPFKVTMPASWSTRSTRGRSPFSVPGRPEARSSAAEPPAAWLAASAFSARMRPSEAKCSVSASAPPRINRSRTVPLIHSHGSRPGATDTAAPRSKATRSAGARQPRLPNRRRKAGRGEFLGSVT